MEKKVNVSLINDYLRKVGYIIKIILAKIKFLYVKKNLYYKFWLIGLGDDIYANNGKVFYEYMIHCQKDIRMYWVCRKENFKYFAQYIPKENLIERGSIKNYILAFGAEAAIYGFSDRDIAPGLFRIYKKHKAVLVNISHGFDGLKGMPSNYYTALPADIICAASTYEQNAKIEFCGAKKERVYLTGFARYDNWKTDDVIVPKKVKKIFIMPTWRDWYEQENIIWENSLLYLKYKELLEELDGIAKNYELEIVCHFHPRMQSFFGNPHLNSLSKVKLDNGDSSIQDLLTESDLIITDYSSILWDAIYMGKLVFLYWFDYRDYKSKRGLMVNNDFYPYISQNQETLIEWIKECVENKMDAQVMSQNYFDWHDNHNCKRIYDLIQKKILEK